MSSPNSPIHSRQSRHLPPPSPPASPPLFATHPLSPYPTSHPIASAPVNTPSSSKAAVHKLPTPPKDRSRSVSEVPDIKGHDNQEGVIDLREGTDYSRYPDIYEYLQLVGRNLEKQGNPGLQRSARELAERGRRHLEQCMAKDKGLFVPPEPYIDTPAPAPGPIRYDEATALEQPPFTANTWAKLLETHLDEIGDVARVRLEEDYPDLAECLRKAQYVRVVKGLGWDMLITPLNRASIDEEVLLTNIRAPIPKFQGITPAPHSPEYTELLAQLYHPMCHPVGEALQEPGYDEAGIVMKISCLLAEQGFPVVKIRETPERYNAPWSKWNEDAECRELRRCDPERMLIYEEDRLQEMMKPVLEYHAIEVRELCAKAARGWCMHDEPYGCCWECGADKEDEEEDDAEMEE